MSNDRGRFRADAPPFRPRYAFLAGLDVTASADTPPSTPPPAGDSTSLRRAPRAVAIAAPPSPLAAAAAAVASPSSARRLPFCGPPSPAPTGRLQALAASVRAGRERLQQLMQGRVTAVPTALSSSYFLYDRGDNGELSAQPPASSPAPSLDAVIIAPLRFTCVHAAAAHDDVAALDEWQRTRPPYQWAAALAAKDRRGERPLHVAVRAGAAAAAELLVRSGADLSVGGSGDQLTALHLAAAAHAPGLLRLLLAAGADANSRDRKRHTALHFAAAASATAVTVATAADALACVELLLSFGAAPDAADADGRTALLYAACCGGSLASQAAATAVVRVLVAQGSGLVTRLQQPFVQPAAAASATTSATAGIDLASLRASHYATLEVGTGNGNGNGGGGGVGSVVSPLHWLCDAGLAPAVATVLDCVAHDFAPAAAADEDEAATDVGADGPADDGLADNGGGAYSATIHALLASREPDQPRDAPLHAAVRSRSAATLRTLLRQARRSACLPFVVDVRNGEGMTALQLACSLSPGFDDSGEGAGAGARAEPAIALISTERSPVRYQASGRLLLH